MHARAGGDPFEPLFNLLVARLHAHRAGRPFRAEDVAALIREADTAYPDLLATTEVGLPDAALGLCTELLAAFPIDHDALPVLDALLERVSAVGAKGSKGQYFTPRNVTALCADLVAPRAGERILDPACGSGGFLLAALIAARHTEPNGDGPYLTGWDFDPRAVRLARALLLFAGRADGDIRQRDSLARADDDPSRGFDVILTNPPFAGDVQDPTLLATYETAASAMRMERDVLFLERCLELLVPGGRMAIVLPHNKLGAKRWTKTRQWLLSRATVTCSIALDRHAFLPHTHQRAGILFVRNSPPQKLRMTFAVSDSSGKDSRGRATKSDDFEALANAVRSFSATAEFPGLATRWSSELDPGAVLAAERYDPRRQLPDMGPHRRLGELVEAVREIVAPERADGEPCLVADTSHARDGVLTTPGAPVDPRTLNSNRKRARPGDVIVSRLRPYLRQVAWIDALEQPLLVSPEFIVLRGSAPGSIAFMAAFLLSPAVQKVLAAAQEGGHHPRVPIDTVLSLPVPEALLARRDSLSAAVEAAVRTRREADAALASIDVEVSAVLKDASSSCVGGADGPGSG